MGHYSVAVSMSASGLDAAFSGIVNIDRGTAHGVKAVIFSDIAAGPDGTFPTGQWRNSASCGTIGVAPSTSAETGTHYQHCLSLDEVRL